MKKKFLVFGSPAIGRAEREEVAACLRSGWIGTGPRVSRFERLFAEYKDTPYALAVNSCTAALHLSLSAIGLEPGGEVLVPAMTFAATANAVIHAGGVPILVDCDIRSMNLDPKDLARKMTPRSRAIVPVHFAGRPCDMTSIMTMARKRRLKVIEDCAHAIESEYKGRKTGTIGDLGCFSFYVTKNVVTGEGGMVVTRNKRLADTVKILALHGMSQDAWKRFSDRGYKHYDVVHAGFKYNMMDIQAAMGIHQLARVHENWKRRERIWNRYNEAFKDLPVVVPAPVEEGTKHAYHLYTLLLDTDRLKISRDDFLEKMTRLRIGVGVHYRALNLHSFYRKKYGYRKGDFPNAEWISDRTVSLPLSAKLTDRETERVIQAVRSILRRRP